MEKILRKIIKIDENLCNGCGRCIPNCPEGALQIIDGKVRLVSDLFCDGLGACVGKCPTGAMQVIERPAEDYDERKVMKNIVSMGKATVAAHLIHLKEHGAIEYYKAAVDYLAEEGISLPKEAHGCPGSRMMHTKKPAISSSSKLSDGSTQQSALQQWPVQISLLNPAAPYFQDADLLVAADCVPLAYADFHAKLLSGRIVAIGCPKFDDTDAYVEKFLQIFKNNHIQSITVARMEVPCCGGLMQVVREALRISNKPIPLKEAVISIGGSLKES
jgi:ferredoxin